MQTELRQKHQNWMSLSGRILEGGYELKELIEADDTLALFRSRVLGDRDLVANTLFLRLNPASSRYQIEVWEALRAFRSPSLNAPLGSGVTDLDGARTTYVVVRQPDESLAGVLRERPLTPAEVKDALLSVTKGLEVLHSNGMVHGSVSPEEIVALGATIRLSGEGARTAGAPAQFEREPAQYLAPESSGSNTTAEADIWCLGASIFESLTQKPWTEAQLGNVEALPEPFATIALRCLVADPSRRCKLNEVSALARGEVKPAPRPKPVPPPAAGTAAQSTPSTAPASAAATEARPAATNPSGLNGTGLGQKESVTSASETHAHASSASAGTSAGTAEPPPANGASFAKDPPIVEKSVPRERVEARGPIRQPMPVVGKRPVPKVRPIHDPVLTPDPIPRREQLAAQRNEVETEERSPKIWLWAGLALLGVLLLVWALRPKTHVTAKPSPSIDTSTSVGNTPARVPTNSWETKTIQPDGTTVISSPVDKAKGGAAIKGPHAATPAKTPTTASKTVESAPEGGRVWRTVLYTYQSEAIAREKLKSLNARHRNLHAEVFSPSGNGAPFLISAGGRVSREEAVQMRKKAISLGLPRDTYIQNYSR